MRDLPAKRWRVDVTYTSVFRKKHELVASHQFRFRLVALLYAWFHHGIDALGFMCAEVTDQWAEA